MSDGRPAEITQIRQFWRDVVITSQTSRVTPSGGRRVVRVTTTSYATSLVFC